jgi:hypothetical protein
LIAFPIKFFETFQFYHWVFNSGELPARESH